MRHAVCILSVPVLLLAAACGGRTSLDGYESGIFPESPVTQDSGSGAAAIGEDSGTGKQSSTGASSSAGSSSASGPQGTGKTGGQGGTAVDAGTPPPPTVACGTASCSAGQDCCVQLAGTGTASICIAKGGECSDGLVLSCANGDDCENAEVCCLSAATAAAACATACTSAGGGVLGSEVELCDPTAARSECPAGSECLVSPVAGLAVCVPEALLEPPPPR